MLIAALCGFVARRSAGGSSSSRSGGRHCHPGHEPAGRLKIGKHHEHRNHHCPVSHPGLLQSELTVRFTDAAIAHLDNSNFSPSLSTASPI